MGNFLTNLVGSIGQKAGQVYNAGVRDYQNVYNNVTAQQHPVAPLAPQAQQQIQNAHYGVLANPVAQQQFIQQQMAPQPRLTLPSMAYQSFGHNFAAPVANTFQVPYSAGRVVAANVTGNRSALNNSHQALASDTANNMLWNDAFRQTSNEVAGAIASRNYMNKTNAANDQLGQTIAKAYGNSPRAKIYGDTVAAAGKNQDINRYLNNVGIDQNTSKLKTGIQLGAPIVSAGAQTALNAYAPGAGGKIAANVAEKGAAKLTTQQVAKQLLKTGNKVGLVNAGVSALSPASAGSTNIGDYLKAGATGYGSGLGLTVGGAIAARPLEAAVGTAKGAMQGVKGAGQAVDNANLRMNGKQSVNSQLNNVLNQRQVITDNLKAAQARGLNDNHPAVKSLQNQLQQNIQDEYAIRAQAPAQTTLQKLTDPILTAKPGLSTGAVDKNGKPISMKEQLAAKEAAAPTTKQLPQSPSEAKPALQPKATGTSAVSSPQLKRSQLTGKALSTPNKSLAQSWQEASQKVAQDWNGAAAQAKEPSSLAQQMATKDKSAAQIQAEWDKQAADTAALVKSQGNVNKDAFTPKDIQKLQAEPAKAPYTAPPLKEPAVKPPLTDKIPGYKNEVQKDVNMLPLAGKGNMADLSAKQAKSVVLDAQRKADGEVMNVVARHTILEDALKRGLKGVNNSEFHQRFNDAVEHPEALQSHLEAVKAAGGNPQAFAKAVDEQHKFNDFAEQRTVASGTPIHHLDNYLHHNIDLSTPELQAKYEKIVSSVKGKSSDPAYAKTRVFKDTREMRAAGFDLAHPNPINAAKDYANQVAGTLARNTTINHIAERAPGHIGTVETANGKIPVDNAGKTFSTGRTNGLNKNFLSPSITDAMNKYVEPHDLGKGYKALDKVAQTLKQSSLGGGGFHGYNMNKRYLTQEVASGILGQPKRLATVLPDMAKQLHAAGSSHNFAQQLTKMRDSGLLDRAFTGGGELTFKKNLDVGAINKTADAPLKTAAKGVASIPHKVNDAFHEPLFGRDIPLKKLMTVQHEMERAGIPLKGDLTPKQQLKLRDITQGANNNYGGINKGLIAKTQVGRQAQRLAMLAPDFTGGNANMIGSMFKGNAKGYAARANFGNAAGSVATAVGVTGALAAAQGQNGVQAAENKAKKIFTPGSGQFADPSVDLPYKDAKGRPLTAKEPGSPIQEAIKAGKDPLHFIQARGSSLVSGVDKLLTNKDYFGNPLVDPNKNPNPSIADKAKAAFGSDLPIPVVQGQKVAGGQNATTGVLNTIGLKVGQDTSTQAYKDTKAYFDSMAAARNSLQSKDRSQFDALHASEVDANGNKVTLNDKQAQANAGIRAGYPNVLAAETAAAQAQSKATGKPVDPFYNLTPQQQQAYEHLQTLPYKGSDYIQQEADNSSWLKNFQNARSDYYKQNPIPPTGLAQNKVQPPTFDANTQGLLDQYFAASLPADKAKLIDNNPAIGNALKAYDTYTNDKRAAQGNDKFNSYPDASPRVQSLLNAAHGLTGKAASAIYNDPEVAKYMQDKNVYSLAQNAGLAQFQGNTLNQKALKATQQIGNYDLIKNPDGTLALGAGSNSNAIQPGAKGVAYNTYGGNSIYGSKKGSSAGSMTRRSNYGMGKVAKVATSKAYSMSRRNLTTSTKFKMPKQATSGTIKANKMMTYKLPKIATPTAPKMATYTPPKVYSGGRTSLNRKKF